MRLFQLSLPSNNQTQEQLVLSGVTYPNSQGYQNIASGIVSTGGVGNYQWEATSLRIQDKTFIAVLGTDASNNKAYIMVFDHFRGMASDLIDTGLSQPGGDGHHASSLGITNTGLLFQQMTSRKEADEVKTNKISFSGANYNPLTWTPWEVLYRIDKPTDDATVEYFHFIPRTGGGYNSVSRRQAGHWNCVLWRNDGTAWGNQAWAYTRIIQVDVTGDMRPYPLGIWTDDGTIKAFVNYIDFDTYDPGIGVVMPYLWYMESYDDGVTWQNVDNTFSQNIDTEGYLLFEDMQAHFMAYDAGVDGRIRANGATLIDGKPACIGGLSVDAEPSLIYWDGLNWQIKKIVCSGHTFSPMYQLGSERHYNNATTIRGNGSRIDIWICELVGSYNQTSHFYSTDWGDTWVFVEQLTSGNYNHVLAKTSFNNTEFSGNGLLISAADYTNGSSNLFIKEL